MDPLDLAKNSGAREDPIPSPYHSYLYQHEQQMNRHKMYDHYAGMGLPMHPQVLDHMNSQNGNEMLNRSNGHEQNIGRPPPPNFDEPLATPGDPMRHAYDPLAISSRQHSYSDDETEQGNNKGSTNAADPLNVNHEANDSNLNRDVRDRDSPNSEKFLNDDLTTAQQVRRESVIMPNLALKTPKEKHDEENNLIDKSDESNLKERTQLKEESGHNSDQDNSKDESLERALEQIDAEQKKERKGSDQGAEKGMDDSKVESDSEHDIKKECTEESGKDGQTDGASKEEDQDNIKVISEENIPSSSKKAEEKEKEKSAASDNPFAGMSEKEMRKWARFNRELEHLRTEQVKEEVETR